MLPGGAPFFSFNPASVIEGAVGFDYRLAQSIVAAKRSSAVATPWVSAPEPVTDNASAEAPVSSVPRRDGWIGGILAPSDAKTIFAAD